MGTYVFKDIPYQLSLVNTNADKPAQTISELGITIYAPCSIVRIVHGRTCFFVYIKDAYKIFGVACGIASPIYAVPIEINEAICHHQNDLAGIVQTGSNKVYKISIGNNDYKATAEVVDNFFQEI